MIIRAMLYIYINRYSLSATPYWLFPIGCSLLAIPGGYLLLVSNLELKTVRRNWEDELDVKNERISGRAAFALVSMKLLICPSSAAGPIGNSE